MVTGTLIHNGGLVMGLFAICVAFALVGFWPEQTTAGVVDWEKEGWL